MSTTGGGGYILSSTRIVIDPSLPKPRPSYMKLDTEEGNNSNNNNNNSVDNVRNGMNTNNSAQGQIINGKATDNNGETSELGQKRVRID